MEQHSLVLLSGSTLDHTHINASSRRAQPLPLHGPRRPFRNLAQGLARLLPQLRQLSQRLRRVPVPATADAPVVRTWAPAAGTDTDALPSSSGQTCAATVTATPVPVRHRHQHHQRAPRWRMRDALRAKATDVRAPCSDHDAAQQLHCRRQQQQDQHQLNEEAQRHQEALMVAEGAQAAPQLSQAVALEGVVQPVRRGPLRQLRRALHFVGSHMRPTGPGENDKNMPERILNVATCGMFFQAGGKIIRLCRSVAARRFGWAFVAVGVIATVYHGSWGRFRNTARKVDYYSIALSSMLLRAVVVGAAPRWLSAAMLVAMPFKPSLVSTSNFMAVEVRYMLLALSHRHLLAEWAAHTSLSVTATACFSLDETPLLRWFPYTHAAFHVLSAAAFLTLPSALNHITGELTAAAA